MEIISNLDEIIENFLMSIGIMAPIISVILTFLEGTLAFLPLFVFLTVNVLTLGPVAGSIISWIATTLGSYVCFIIFRKGFYKKFEKIISNKPKIKKFMKRVSKLSFSQLVLIIAIPFTPSFFVNLGAGLSKISEEKFLDALILGKVVIVLFWGYIGSSLLECLNNPIELVKVAVLVLIAYILGTIVNKNFDLDGKY